MEILMLGGSGILSTEVCNLAIKRGMKVTMMNRGNRLPLIHPKATLIIGDLRLESEENLSKKLSGYKYDVIIDFISYTEEQLKKTLKIVQGKCKQYIFISSATVYVNGEDGVAITEDTPIGNTKWKYSLNKSECEWYLEKNISKLRMEYTIIRPYVTYGKTRIPYQIAPIEYYTLVNRILIDKPIPICGMGTRCTITNARDFAVGTVGLFLNEKAYNEAVHITSNENTSWINIILELGNKLGKEVKLIEVPMEYIKKGKNILGFETDEIVGDKGRNMIFDNTKIKLLVHDYKGDIKFGEGIDASLNYFESDPNNKVINYIWDARVDAMLSKMKDGSNYKSKLRVSAYGESSKIKDKIKYILNRYTLLYVSSNFCKKVICKIIR